MRARHSQSHVSHERWLVSYADLITLLFAFFVVLYAFAKADEKQHRQVSAAINSGFRSLSIAPNPNSAVEGARTSAIPAARKGVELTSSPGVLADLETMRRDLLARLSPQIAKNSVAVQLSPEGLVVSLREAGFFNSGSAEPRPDTIPVLDEIAQSVRGTPYDLRVEGHTDNLPIHNSMFDSNWELSSARATRVARLLLQLNAVPPDQLSAAGYAEHHPFTANDTPEGRAKNRRVDLVVMPRAFLQLPAREYQASNGKWRRIADD